MTDAQVMDAKTSMAEEQPENVKNVNNMDCDRTQQDVLKLTKNKVKLLKRFCFLGSFEPVFIHLRRCIVINPLLSTVKNLLENVSHTEFLPLMREVLQEVSLVRHDEALFIYAAYLALPIDMESKTVMRIAFPVLVSNDNDLFLFCKYTSLINKKLNRKCFSRTIRKAITAWYEMRTVDEIRSMWLTHRGLHGFTHKTLMKLCHISDVAIGSAEIASTFFKTCTELMKEARLEESNQNSARDLNQAHEQHSERKSPTPTSVIAAVAKLRVTKSKHNAMKIIRKHKLPYSHVPGRWLHCSVIMESVLPTMTYLQVLKCWRKMASNKHFEINPKILKICKKMLGNLELAKASCIHPVHILMSIHDTSKDALCSLPKEKIKAWHLEYLHNLYKDSFHWPTEPGNLRMHITLNLQTNYKKKFLENHNKLTYFDACLALAVGYCKREAKVDVFHWVEEKCMLKKIPFAQDYTTEFAFNAYNMVVNEKNNQRLITPIMNALNSEEVYDIFLCIVPTAGRGNPRQKSNLLCSFLDRYRENKNPNARFVILDLLKFNRRSMSYNDNNFQNILEICGLDNHTTTLIHNFATQRFD